MVEAIVRRAHAAGQTLGRGRASGVIAAQAAGEEGDAAGHRAVGGVANAQIELGVVRALRELRGIFHEGSPWWKGHASRFTGTPANEAMTQ
ncbi:hypothetical protein A3I99_03300 [Candidatus Kaiserbacteria bacterium RIFCSPLOWO2_02_FULL_45_11b]|uniref:Uncharacterized protein n=1 Tax=Candidatus Kaiserbacteria bacterium RIFCSPLOWO2_12_FULL_45_26 TaxID=1798525 RepID=A0A1F6FFZ6_9BACT|nr:MAG: hypothetical protein A2929_04985 [Candidatus Kaiserbacteria bacterium RIFCSPLOWO2_01_FULL_45_25]OGG80812.1 MAG: hypothetical protein A3I99_03300 [Candidatus Kaiserbacteria bacterium RIFCSPLOWO2_02_FULL_45_11b]OGG84778.1 MAG: hypothetical protein A3G90_01690 [Candidatus Kaiserbacteria bacterium RIFCSPLOWO2_12_FULL_45_26]